MWDLIVSVPDHCLSFYFESYLVENPEDRFSRDVAQMFSFVDIQYKVSYALLKWVYTDEINIEADSSFLLELLRAATRFKLEHLRQR